MLNEPLQGNIYKNEKEHKAKLSVSLYSAPPVVAQLLYQLLPSVHLLSIHLLRDFLVAQCENGTTWGTKLVSEWFFQLFLGTTETIAY